MRIINTTLLIVFFCVAAIGTAQTTTNEGIGSGTQGTNNSFFGYQTGQNTTQSANTFVGASSGKNNTTGQGNTFLGFASGELNTTGRRNIFIGYKAGPKNVSGNRNIFIGTRAGEGSVDETNKLYIQNLIAGTTISNPPLVYGDFTTGQLGINTKTIPTGYNFAVNGGAMITGDVVSTGRIAIGTAEEDPDYKLTVKGKVHVQEVKVDLEGVLRIPDYVFYEDYNLKTLEEVQNYIKKEGHLPNIPSAEEMVKEGLNLKEMNLKLLEKIEELTLYTIAQEKTIKEHKKAIKEQKESNQNLENRLQKLEQLLKQ